MKSKVWPLILSCGLILGLLDGAHADEPWAVAANVATILAERCVVCHGPKKQAGGYRLDSFADARKPGDSGVAPIVASKPDQSELVKRLVSSNADERMPAEAERLPEAQIALIQQWIASGAQLSPELDAQPLTSWKQANQRPQTPEHYSAALPVTALAIRQTDAITVWTSGYGEVLQWRVTDADAKLIARVPVAGVHISDVEMSSSGRWLAVASGTPGSQGFVELFDLENALPNNWKPTRSIPSADVPADIALAPDSSRLAIGQTDGTLLIVNIAVAQSAQNTPRALAPHADAILALNWSESSGRLITGSRDRTAKIFDTTKWELIANYDRHERSVGGVAYVQEHPVSFDETGTLRLWSGDDSDRTLAERGNLARFLEPVVAWDKQLWLAMGPNLESFQAERKTVDDGKDDQGKPKTKTTTRWKPDQVLTSNDRGWLLSIDASEELIAAGSETGQVFLWRKNEKQPWRTFIAKP